MKSRLAVVAFSVLSIAPLLGAPRAFGQRSGDSVSCPAALDTPSPDSEVVELVAILRAFDTTRKLPADYNGLFVQGLREMLVLPPALAIDTYHTRAGINRLGWDSAPYAARTLRAFYRLTLHRDGRLTGAHTVGGVRNAAFDRAIVAALVALDSSRLLPAPSLADDAYEGDSLLLRLTITPGPTWGTRKRNVGNRESADGGALFHLRVPILRVTHALQALPSTPPTYPPGPRNAGIEGEVLAEFLVRADGEVDPATVQVLRTNHVDFARSVIDALPRIRFEPLMVAGCPVATLVQVPFAFSLAR